MQLKTLKNKLNEFHKKLSASLLKHTSQLVENQFLGEFNVSGFHNEVQELANKEKSFWGIDTCLRLKDDIDENHSFLFEMGIFAKSIDLQKDFREPFKDDRFARFQEEIITQFIQLIKSFGIKTEDLEVSYLGNITFGGLKGRDKSLKRKYTFPEDKTSRKVLQRFDIKCYPTSSIINIDIHAVEDSLVGLRIEIAHKGIEIATIVFDCFKLKEGKLIPINYVGGYAIGIERFISVLSDNRDFLYSVPKYVKAFSALKSKSPIAESSLVKKDVFRIVYGTEVLAKLKETEELSKGQKEIFRKFKTKFRESCNNLGMGNKDVLELIQSYQNENIDYRR